MMESKNHNEVGKAEPEIEKGEFDTKMARGIEQAKAGEGVPAEEFFALLRQEISGHK